MSQEELETAQAIKASCFDLVKQGYSLDDIKGGLRNAMIDIGSDTDQRLVDAQKALDEFQEYWANTFGTQADFYRDK